MTSLLEQSVFFGVAVSIAAYESGNLLKKKFKSALLNPLLISVAVTILILVAFHINYATYYEGAKYLSYLLTPATVCLAIPLYEQMELLKKNPWDISTLFVVVFSFVHATLSSVPL